MAGAGAENGAGFLRATAPESAVRLAAHCSSDTCGSNAAARPGNEPVSARHFCGGGCVSPFTAGASFAPPSDSPRSRRSVPFRSVELRFYRSVGLRGGYRFGCDVGLYRRVLIRGRILFVAASCFFGLLASTCGAGDFWLPTASRPRRSAACPCGRARSVSASPASSVGSRRVDPPHPRQRSRRRPVGAGLLLGDCFYRWCDNRLGNLLDDRDRRLGYRRNIRLSLRWPQHSRRKKPRTQPSMFRRYPSLRSRSSSRLPNRLSHQR